MIETLRGTPELVGTGLRRDRWTLVGWIGGLVTVATLSARATLPLYPTLADRRSAAAAVNASAGTATPEQMRTLVAPSCSVPLALPEARRWRQRC